MCQKSTAHEQRRSRGESRKLRFGSIRTAPKIWQEGQHDLHSPPQSIYWREHTIGAVHDRNLPTRSLQVPESYEKFLWHLVKVRSFARLDCVTMMSEMTIAVMVVSASCHHLTRADSSWSRISWFSRVTLPWLRGGTSVAPWRHKSSHVPVFRRLFDRLPVRFSTSDLHHRILRKKLYHIRAYDFGVQFSFKRNSNSKKVRPFYLSENVGKYQNGTSYTRVSARHKWDARAPLWVSFSKGFSAKNVLSPSGSSTLCGSWEQYFATFDGVHLPTFSEPYLYFTENPLPKPQPSSLIIYSTKSSIESCSPPRVVSWNVTSKKNAPNEHQERERKKKEKRTT